eukprot:TRINITY_DN24415_c0_g1_i1.p1 TRINITY_DN24415_c0_g1~~TRINITY_DN24415_c0_g1_i1.p1  ORF type:complete len:296 (+),score=69.48 TRINITY_DN24415_c0_g1_i1:397-1284(+)
MPAHIVLDNLPVKVDHDGKRELLQILHSFVQVLVRVQKLGVEEPSDEMDEILSESEELASNLGEDLKQFAARAVCAAAKAGSLFALEGMIRSKGCCRFVGGIPNTWNEIDPIGMFHSAVVGGDVAIAQLVLAAYPAAELLSRLTRDGTALHLAAYTGKPAMIRMLIDAGADVNASSSGYNVVSVSKADKSRPVTDISVMDVPWKYQSKTQEFTAADIFHGYCPYKNQGKYAEQAEVEVLLDGHLAKRHGAGYLATAFVHWDALTGEQHPEDPEGARMLRMLSLGEVDAEGEKPDE